MTIAIELKSKKDRLSALGVLGREGERYYRIPGHRFFVTPRAIAALETAGIKFKRLGEKQESQRASSS